MRDNTEQPKIRSREPGDAREEYRERQRDARWVGPAAKSEELLSASVLLDGTQHACSTEPADVRLQIPAIEIPAAPDGRSPRAAGAPKTISSPAEARAIAPLRERTGFALAALAEHLGKSLAEAEAEARRLEADRVIRLDAEPG